MNPSPRVFAAAASDSYIDRPQSDVDSSKNFTYLDGQKYSVFGYKDDPATGFHATAYKEVAPPHNIILAYRGTDPDIKHHTRTTVQDAIVDFTMVKARLNRQEDGARAFTKEMLDKAEKYGISKEQVIVAGHSLGGTLAEIEAAKFGLHGSTINAYGAVDLGYRVPEGGNQITNYVMAGDVVSAASHHFGKVVPLASNEDIQGLQVGRYLDAAPGAPPPNPLLAMRLSDHSATHFTGEAGNANVLSVANFKQYEKNYTDHQAAFDHFRNDVRNDRAGLAVVLNRADNHNIETTLANLPPQLQQQLAEYHAVLVDAPIQSAVEHLRAVQDIEQGLEHDAGALRSGGQSVQQGAEHLSQSARVAGQVAQQQANAVSIGAQTFAPIDPLAAASLSLGAKAAGYVMHAEAEGVAEASHLAGRAVHAGSQWTASQLHGATHAVEQGAHLAGKVAKGVAHVYEAEAVVVADVAIDIYQSSKAQAQAISDDAAHAYGITKQALSHGVDATERGATQAYDALTHRGQWFHHTAPSSSPRAHPTSVSPHPQSQAITPVDPTHARNDPRHLENPDHTLYSALKARIPEAGENRLVQFTAACHTNRITADNLSTIHLDRANMTIGFHGSSPMSTPATVDLKIPPAQPQQSIQHIQQYDQQQAQIHVQGAQAQQGAIQGGPAH